MRNTGIKFDLEFMQMTLDADRAPVMDLFPTSVFETPASSLKGAHFPLPEYQGFADDYLPSYSGDQESPVELPTGMAE